MLTTLVAVATLTQGQPPKPSQLVSKMLAYYHGAETLTGEILYTQSAQGRSVNGKTIIQFERPNKLYVRQDMKLIDYPSTYIIVSDGKAFSYNMPLSQAPDGRGRLYERVEQDGRKLDVGQIYAAASKSIADRNAPLDIAIARNADLEYLAGQWATMQIQGTEQMDGKTAYLITGKWREYKQAPVSGDYQIAVTADGELLRYALKNLVGIPELPQVPPQEITTTWKVNFVKNGKPDPKLFRVF